MKRLAWLSLLCACLSLPAAAFWQSRDSNYNNFQGGSPPSYQGPGDLKSGAIAWGSCARVYQASLASTSTNLCDLADSTNGAVVLCTLRATSTGLVDLTACSGGGVPATICAAATGAHCQVVKIYDQTGNSKHWAQSNGANAPRLDFATQNGLPGINCIGTGARTLMVTPAINFVQPYSLSTVYKRVNTAGTTIAVEVVIGGARFIDFGAANSGANSAVIDAGTTNTFTGVSDTAFHAVNGVFNDPGNSAMMIDSTDHTSLSVGTGAGNVVTEICEDGVVASKMNGPIMEMGYWLSAMSPTERTNIDANQRSATNGYNF